MHEQKRVIIDPNSRLENLNEETKNILRENAEKAEMEAQQNEKRVKELKDKISGLLDRRTVVEEELLRANKAITTLKRKEQILEGDVLPGLYVGNYRDSKDSSQLTKHNITHIVAIHDTARRIHSDKHYLCIMASDTPDQNLTQYFSLSNDFIHAARLRDGNVLIHCLAGMSRSVTVAVAYIMSVTTLNYKDALKVVRAGRNVANPNLGFLKQLEEFECTRLIEERRRLKERYPSLALVYKDQEQCALMLNNYEELLQSRSICEANCALGETCPTGLCR
ncbi:unnamed protein product [Ceutorhynchus assimilis]|uniref:Dual specificity protein phosphatase 15 n=1 Tax=Ceutorhynchus assimilis TaxID=467358 RepID=A0A9N9MGB6_9CUCU|nr:unnamed protein product [Ceutorhynchus assimilis]